jgi:hypothetical protein
MYLTYANAFCSGEFLSSSWRTGISFRYLKALCRLFFRALLLRLPGEGSQHLPSAVSCSRRESDMPTTRSSELLWWLPDA